MCKPIKIFSNHCYHPSPLSSGSSGGSLRGKGRPTRGLDSTQPAQWTSPSVQSEASSSSSSRASWSISLLSFNHNNDYTGPMFYSLCAAIFIFILEQARPQLELCRWRIVVQVFWRHQRRGRETAPRERQVWETFEMLTTFASWETFLLVDLVDLPSGRHLWSWWWKVNTVVIIANIANIIYAAQVSADVSFLSIPGLPTSRT